MVWQWITGLPEKFFEKTKTDYWFQCLKCQYFLAFWLLHGSKLKDRWVVDKRRQSRNTYRHFSPTVSGLIWTIHRENDPQINKNIIMLIAAPWRNGFSQVWRGRTGDHELEHQQWPIMHPKSVSNLMKWVQIPQTRFCLPRRDGNCQIIIIRTFQTMSTLP